MMQLQWPDIYRASLFFIVYHMFCCTAPFPLTPPKMLKIQITRSPVYFSETQLYHHLLDYQINY